jgi:hypothetical protein
MLLEVSAKGGWSPSDAIVENSERKMDMAGLSAVAKSRIAGVLDSTRFKLQGFAVKYDDESGPVATITFSSSPECQFIISSIDNDAFATSERPGIHSDKAETFSRANFEICVQAIKEWIERIIDEENDWILDEFGGAADRTPSF